MNRFAWVERANDCRGRGSGDDDRGRRDGRSPDAADGGESRS